MNLISLCRYLVRLLIMRGETSVRILDINPPAQDILDNPSISFIKTDITSLESVRGALTAPFPSTGAPPSVIFHTAAIIRFWERASYCWEASYRVNVTGTKNVLVVAKELSAMVVYTSSAETVSGCPKFLRVDWDTYPVSITDDRPPTFIVKESCYPRSKRMAEQLVISASANEGLKTGILRPGQSVPSFLLMQNLLSNGSRRNSTIIGPNDRLVTSTLTMAQSPIWDQPWTSTEVCVWDVAAAHLVYEDALNRIPEVGKYNQYDDYAKYSSQEVSGEAFLITGRGPAWSIEDVRAAIKVSFGDASEIMLKKSKK